MRSPFSQHLYLRIWLAIVAAVVVLTLLFAWLWRLEAEHERGQRPGREIVVHNAQGELIGRATLRAQPVPGQGLEFEVPTRDGSTLLIQLPRPNRSAAQFARPWWRPPFDLVWLLSIVAIAVALGAYPIVRRLTKRLEALRQGVERWGEGDLSLRLPADGGDEVAFLAERFNIAAQRVQSMLHSHKSLLANASHELRSPLARIRMGLELMGTQPTPAFKEEIARNIRELDQLVDEILLASRLDANPDDVGVMETVDLIGLCAEECAQTQAELEIEDGCSSLQVLGVPKLLHRCLRNLLENARRHAAGAVTVFVQQQGEQAVLRVCDHGPGVPAPLREHIFEPFYRLPGASERDGGVGLGLSLVKSIAARHGGQVYCEDRPGGGACFVLCLPRLVQPSPA